MKIPEYLSKAVELLLLFIALPVVFYFDLVPFPKIPALVLFTLFCLLVLWFDKDFDSSSFFRWKVSSGYLKKILLRFLASSIILFSAVWHFMPDSFLIFPRTNPRLWLMIMFFYPLVSAFPQELIYRSYFFHRFKILIPNGTVMIIASAIAFCFLHIIYDNYVALALTLAGGYLFSKTYSDTKSLLAASLEHALYGCAIFTSGLGRYFYEPF